jgi:hypothetical protein
LNRVPHAHLVDNGTERALSGWRFDELHFN